MVVFCVRNRRLKAFLHVDGDTLFREGQIGHRLFNLLAADQAGDQVQLLRRNAQHAGLGHGLVISNAAGIILFTHGAYFRFAFLSAA